MAQLLGRQSDPLSPGARRTGDPGSLPAISTSASSSHSLLWADDFARPAPARAASRETGVAMGRHRVSSPPNWRRPLVAMPLPIAPWASSHLIAIPAAGVLLTAGSWSRPSAFSGRRQRFSWIVNWRSLGAAPGDPRLRESARRAFLRSRRAPSRSRPLCRAARDSVAALGDLALPRGLALLRVGVRPGGALRGSTAAVAAALVRHFLDVGRATAPAQTPPG